VTIYGGQAIRQQAEPERAIAEIIVGTPGRVMDMVERGLLAFANVRFAVLDEVDRMLDIGFREDIRLDPEVCPTDAPDDLRLATISVEIEELARVHARPGEDRHLVGLADGQPG
jgi:ATP-dependent RNA helicase DeaD